ncbi:MAG: ribonuclease HII [Chlamydiales bacterium]|nr:ribonuclease HII [Chlamydiia bacterium]MCP5508241.1 ribonuclease HII [Chlamydiales bacterium]
MPTQEQKQQRKKRQTPNIQAAELCRLKKLSIYEEQARRNGYTLIAGIDEAGRGPLAGPVVAAACVVPENYYLIGMNDSKQLTPAKRCALYEEIIHDKNIFYGIGIVSPEVIDQVNIYQATIQAMTLAVQNLPLKPDYLLVDGVALKDSTIPAEKIVKGDAKSHTIACASVVAKETRDRLMCEYDRQWPEYGFARHKGYGTEAHREAIAHLGPCPIHRKTFEPIKSRLFIGS